MPGARLISHGLRSASRSVYWTQEGWVWIERQGVSNWGRILDAVSWVCGKDRTLIWMPNTVWLAALSDCLAKSSPRLLGSGKHVKVEPFSKMLVPSIVPLLVPD